MEGVLEECKREGRKKRVQDEEKEEEVEGGGASDPTTYKQSSQNFASVMTSPPRGHVTLITPVRHHHHLSPPASLGVRVAWRPSGVPVSCMWGCPWEGRAVVPSRGDFRKQLWPSAVTEEAKLCSGETWHISQVSCCNERRRTLAAAAVPSPSRGNKRRVPPRHREK